MTRRHERTRFALPLTGALLAACLVLAVLVSAAFTDAARLRTELSSRFEIAVLDDEGAIAALTRAPGQPLTRTSTAELMPGTTLELPVRIANNSPGPAFAPVLRVKATGPEAALLGHLRLAVSHTQDGTATVLTGDPADPEDSPDLRQEISVAPPELAPRTGAAQAAGEHFSGGSRSSAVLTVRLTLTDDADLRRLSHASWTIDLSLEGTSHT
ncbi:hypothetical protein [Brevibacterium sp.]|uniref:hypothetical protein n=1 Tax=Brevibacterium sp. TaxID=1701 RepID=UPI0025C14803|nr:hypothetical protein [Brevibacterium sp.]